ncbi:MAG TPA: hypothetical protein VF411_10710 [Bacteroidia bacterium]
MNNVATPHKKEQTTIPTAENKKGIENHKKIATHFEKAAAHHKDAAKHHEDNNHDKAAECTVKANGHHCAATELLKDDAKQHASV